MLVTMNHNGRSYGDNGGGGCLLATSLLEFRMVIWEAIYYCIVCGVQHNNLGQSGPEDSRYQFRLLVYTGRQHGSCCATPYIHTRSTACEDVISLYGCDLEVVIGRADQDHDILGSEETGKDKSHAFELPIPGRHTKP